MKQIVGLIVVAIAVFITSFIVFYELGTPPLEHWDEGFYGVTIQEMIERSNYIVLYFNDQTFLEKPPFQMWITALFSSFFGLSEWTIRLPSAVSAVIIIALVTWHSYHKWGWLPTIFAVVTLVLNDIFVWRSRTGNLDILSTLFFILIFFVIQWNNRWRYGILGLLFGLLYLTKLGLVVFPLAIFGFYELLYQKGTIWKNWKQYAVTAGVALIIPVIWLSIGTLMIGHTFWESYILQADQKVGNSSFSYFGIEYWQYAYYSLQRHFFWIFLAGLGLVAMNIRKGHNFLLLAFSMLLIIVLSFVERKNNWYLVPAMPFWSFTIAYAIHSLLQYIEIFQRKLEKKFPIIRRYSEFIETKYAFVSPILVSFVVLFLVLFVGYKAYRTYTINIVPRYTTYSTTKEQQSARYIKEHSKENEVIVRTDHLYPATIYYAERNVIIAPFRDSEEIYDEAQQNKIQWFVGKEGDMLPVQEELNKRSVSYEVIETPSDEIILRLK